MVRKVGCVTQKLPTLGQGCSEPPSSCQATSSGSIISGKAATSFRGDRDCSVIMVSAQWHRRESEHPRGRLPNSAVAAQKKIWRGKEGAER